MRDIQAEVIEAAHDIAQSMGFSGHGKYSDEYLYDTEIMNEANAAAWIAIGEAQLEMLFAIHSKLVRDLENLGEITNASECAWLIMSKMGEHEEDAGGPYEFYCGDWEISQHQDQWLFDDSEAKFFDVDLLAGLQVILEK